MKQLNTIQKMLSWASDFYNKKITPANIIYLINYGKISKNIVNGQTLINKKELEYCYNSQLERQNEY